jgi:hypothetical protein
MKILDTAMTEIVSGNSTRYYSKYVVDEKEHTETLNNFKYQNIINPNNEITIGNTCASSVTFSIYMPTVSLENKEITVFEGVKVNEEIQYIQLGIFTVTKQTSDGEYTSYEAYDRMYKADMPYFSDMTFPSTDKAILNEICSKLGISLATNIVTAHTINEKPQGYTYREIIGYMAMLQGSNAVINADGNLELRWYKDSGYVLDGHKYYQQGVTFTTSKDFIIQKLTCNNTKSGSTEQSEITSGDGATGLTFTNPFMTQAILDEIYKKIGGFTFRPLTVKFVGDYRLEVGDIITVNKGGVDYKVPIMQITHECDGGLMDTVTSIGQSDTENTSVASGPITKQMERYYADLILVNKALINKLSVDEADIRYASIETLKAVNANIDNLKTNKLDATYADIINANVESLKAANAEITQLKANSLTADIADLKYAQIDFANVKGQVVTTSLIKDGAVTNEKVGNLSANKITSGEIDASKIKVYNLNADYLTVGYINGKRIGSGSIELDKLAEEVPTKEYLDKVQEELQGQIDGNIETFTKTEIPTLNNEPAVNWTDNATRKKHIGDICYVVNPASSADGYSYRFANTGTEQAPVYEWVLIKDSDVTKALQDIININGEITGIKKFNVEISSWKTDTDSELSSLKTRTTGLETDMGNKVDTTTFNEVKQTVDENNSTITKMSETLSKKADSGTVTTLSNTVNSIKQTTDSNTSSISSLTTTVTKVENTANSASKTATAANNTANTAKSTADSALSKVNTLTTTVTNQGSSITQLQGSITNKVWKTDITESVNNLQIGGTNMLLWTTTMPGKFSSDSSGASSKGTVSYQSDGSAFVINNNSNFRFQYHPDVNVMIGATYVVSAYYRDVSGAQAHQFQIAYTTASGKYADFHGVTGTREVGDGWKQSYLVFTIPDTIKTSNLITVYLRSGADYTLYNHSYYIKNVKLELGNKVTTWSPAPEDVSSGINAVDTKVTAVSNQYTTLNQTVNSISATVNSHTSQIATKADNSTVTTINNKVTSLTTDLSGFKTTVSNTYATKNSLSNYATTTAMNSAISQSANSITQSVSATYATKSSLSSYATTASLSAYIAKTDTGTLKSCIEAIADTINITARGGLNLSGNRFTLSSTNTSITASGVLTCNNLIANGGKIAQWNIANNSINSTTSDSKYWAGMTTPSKGSDWVYAIMSNSGTASVPSWSPQWYVAGNGFMYAANAAITGSITATKSGVLTTTINANGISVTGSDNSTVITAQGFLTNQYLGSTIDCRGTIFDGMLIYPKGKTDLTYEWVAKLSNKSIAISPNNNISVDYCTKMTNEEISIRGELGSSAYAIMATYGFSTGGNLYCGGTKNRMVETEHFGTVLQNALETPTPTFEDYGEGVLDESGKCRIYLEDKFIETIDTNTEYTIFLTKYGVGDIYVSDRQPDYFEVTGTPNLTFSWQLLATQRDYNSIRLDKKTDSIIDKVNSDELFKMTTEFIEEWEGDLDYAE